MAAGARDDQIRIETSRMRTDCIACIDIKSFGMHGHFYRMALLGFALKLRN